MRYVTLNYRTKTLLYRYRVVSTPASRDCALHPLSYSLHTRQHDLKVWTLEGRMDINNPDDMALLLVQQFLQDRGYDAALKETEKAHGLKYVEDKLPKGSMLLQMIYERMEAKAPSSADAEEAALQEQEEGLLQGGSGDYPLTQIASIDGLHAANITTLCCCPNADSVFTGSGDGSVQAITFSGSRLWQTKRVGGGGAISLAVQQRNGPARLLVGYMDGTISILDAKDGCQLASQKTHTKYVVRAVWAPNSDHVLSVSWDGTVAVSEFVEDNLSGGTLQVGQTLPFQSAVQDVLFLPGTSRIVLALRDTNLLRIRNFPTIETGDEKVNLNALGDSHVSFSARQLAISPDLRYLLVSTDSSRIVLLRIQGWRHLPAQIVGLPLDTFHNSVACWHSSAFYIMAAAAAGQIYVFHTGTGKVVAKCKAHEQNVRWLDYDAKRNLLFSCSFDRTVKIWGKHSDDHSGLVLL